MLLAFASLSPTRRIFNTAHRNIPASSFPSSQAGLAPLTAGCSWRASCKLRSLSGLSSSGPSVSEEKNSLQKRSCKKRAAWPASSQPDGQIRSAEARRPLYVGPPSCPPAQSPGGVFESRREATAPPPQ